MCGTHAADGTPIAHHHGPIFRPRRRDRSRRAFLGEFGAGTLALAVFTPTVLAACSSSDGSADPTLAPSDPTAPPTDPPSTTAATGSEPAATTASTAAPTTDAEPAPTDAPADETLRWARANLGFVSAYVLARGNTAAIVDTGVPGSAAAIGESLTSLGLNYSDVDHVILTHNHQDHAGSTGAVLEQAINATAYAGEADLAGIDVQDISGLVGGEDIFGFEMLATPGHTAGHMAVIDHAAGLLVAGDAIFSEDGGVVEGPAQFFADIPQSRDSIRALAQLSFNTLLVGHGDPIEQNADTAVADLAASLG